MRILLRVFIFVCSSLSLSANLASANSVEAPYLRYVFVKGDTIENVLKRLDLAPLHGKNGAVAQFESINPKIVNNFKTKIYYQVQPGEEVFLPVKAPADSDNKSYVVKNNQLFFINPKYQKSPDDYTTLLNLKTLAGGEKSDRQPAQVRLNKKIDVPSVGQGFFDRYDFGVPVVKVPVDVDTELFKRLQQEGFIPAGKTLEKTVYVEIPLVDKAKRSLAAVNKESYRGNISEPWVVSVKTLSASRNYSVSDTSGQTGDIGIDPAFGVQIGFAMNYAVLDLQFRGQLQTETFKQDNTIAINQETDQRLDLRLRQNFDLGYLQARIGGGLSYAPSFVTISNNSLEAKHLQIPYAHFSLGGALASGPSYNGGWEMIYDQMFGAQDGLYKLESGFRTGLLVENSLRIAPKFELTGDVGVLYRDDQPATYEQTSLGFQLLFGVKWQLGVGE